MRRGGVRCVAREAGTALVVGGRGGVIEQGPDIRVLEQGDDVSDRGAPVLEIGLDFLPGGGQDPVVVVVPGRLRLEGDDVHERALCDREGQDVAVVAEPHDAVARHFVAEQVDGLVHRNDAPVCVLAREDRVSGRMVCTEDNLPEFTLDAITAHGGAGLCRCPVSEMQAHSICQLLDIHDPLLKRHVLVRHQRDQLVQEMRTAYGAVADTPSGQRDHFLPGLPNATVHTGVEIEPYGLLFFIRIAGGLLAVPFPYPGIE